MGDGQEILIVFAHYPVRGESAPSLIPALGEAGAVDLQREMTEYIFSEMRRTGITIEVWYTGGSEAQMRTWLGDDLSYVEQGDGEQGERLKRAFRSAFERKFRRVALMGTDCAAVRAENIEAVFKELRISDVVLGPSSDGGYYLIGLHSYIFEPLVLEEINWGSVHGLDQMLSKSVGVRWVQMPCWRTVNSPEDIPPVISVVVPALNSAEHIGPVLERVNDSFRTELIVVDGGSEDDTLARAEAAGATVMKTEPGRARQMNAGAEAASGEILLFLHADTLLPTNWDSLIRRACSGDMALGAFDFSVSREALSCEGCARLIEWSLKMRSQAFQLPCGEQGLFLKSDVFAEAGGLPNHPVLEDYELARRVHALGRIVVLDVPAVSSARRWDRMYAFKTLFTSPLILLAYGFRIPSRWLWKLCN